MRVILYFTIVLVSTTLGSITGMGGGVIIKPSLDLVSNFDILTINVYSSITVFFMTVVSIVKHIKNGFSIMPVTGVLLGMGSVAGGYSGEKLFYIFVEAISNNDIAKSIQSIILIGVLLTSIIYVRKKENIKSFKVKSPAVIFLSGAFLGTVSSFLGIGGGPINVSLLMLLFSFDVKEAAIYSIITIFFSQLSKLINIAVSTGFDAYKSDILFYMIAAGIAGGVLGSAVSRKIDNRKVEKLFKMVIVAVIIIASYTAIKPILLQ